MNAIKCYACDASATGKADHEGEIKPACKRHAQAKLGSLTACIYCEGETRSGSLKIDGEYAHKKCHNIACSDKDRI